MQRNRVTFGACLGVIAAGALFGCTVEKAQPTAAEEAEQRRNLREVRGNIDMFKTNDVGDPTGRGKIPAGR